MWTNNVVDGGFKFATLARPRRVGGRHEGLAWCSWAWLMAGEYFVLKGSYFNCAQSPDLSRIVGQFTTEIDTISPD